jgi:2,4-dienoyl-CoA reductase-like NADH-dependent reductase (Old Yellow Enzyme family)
MIQEILHPLLQPPRFGDLLVPDRVLIAPLTRGRAKVFEHLTDQFVRKYYEQRAT